MFFIGPRPALQIPDPMRRETNTSPALDGVTFAVIRRELEMTLDQLEEQIASLGCVRPHTAEKATRLKVLRRRQGEIRAAMATLEEMAG